MESIAWIFQSSLLLNTFEHNPRIVPEMSHQILRENSSRMMNFENSLFVPQFAFFPIGKNCNSSKFKAIEGARTSVNSTIKIRLLIGAKQAIKGTNLQNEHLITRRSTERRKK